MEREIKFRGKTDSGEWVYGVPFFKRQEKICFIINNLKTLNFTEEDSEFQGRIVKPKTVGQFTGLKDKNGVEIYEGDILKAKSSDVIHPQDLHKIKEEYISSPIYWDTGCFYLDFNCFSFYDTNKYMEVIGNIHENPELL